MDLEPAAPPSSLARLAARLDALNEFEREPVAPEKLKGGRHFAALFGGEHIAGTDFVIGSFFVLHGVSARDLLLGLLVGNLLAVLSWTLICAPIATRVRLTPYCGHGQERGARHRLAARPADRARRAWFVTRRQ